MELNKIYALSPETMMMLEDPRYELVVGMTHELLFTLERKLYTGREIKLSVHLNIPTDGYGTFQKEFTCTGNMNLDDFTSLHAKDSISVVFQGWKSGDRVKVNGPVGWSISAAEQVREITVFDVELFLRDTVEGIITKVDVQ